MNGGKSRAICIIRGRSRELSMGHQGVLDDTTAENKTSPHCNECTRIYNSQTQINYQRELHVHDTKLHKGPECKKYY